MRSPEELQVQTRLTQHSAAIAEDIRFEMQKMRDANSALATQRLGNMTNMLHSINKKRTIEEQPDHTDSSTKNVPEPSIFQQELETRFLPSAFLKDTRIAIAALAKAVCWHGAERFFSTMSRSSLKHATRLETRLLHSIDDETLLADAQQK